MTGTLRPLHEHQVLRDVVFREEPLTLSRKTAAAAISSVPAVQGVQAPTAPVQPAPPVWVEATELAKIREEARQTGEDEGFAEGLKRGAQEGRQAGYQAGYQAGRKEGVEAGLAAGHADGEEKARAAHESETAASRAGLQTAIRNMEAALAAFDVAAAERIAALEDDMVALAWETLCRMLGDKAATPEGVRMQVAETLKAWRSHGPLDVHLHPDDYVSLHEARGETASHAAVPLPNPVRWLADAEVELGGCIVRSADGGLDARLETALAALRSALTEARRRQQAQRGRQE